MAGIAGKRRGRIADGLRSLDSTLASIGHTPFVPNQNGR
jgi:hypothetical protein